MVFTEQDIAEASVGLKVAVGVVQMLTAMKDTEDAQTIRAAIPELAEEFKPLFQGTSRFFVQMDIDAIKQMEDAGIERHYAVALRLRQSMPKALCEIVGKASNVKKGATK